MKPFNLEEYLKNPNREIVTRDGRNVKIICTNFDSEKYPIIGEIKVKTVFSVQQHVQTLSI